MKKITIGVAAVAIALTGLVTMPAYAVDCPDNSVNETAETLAGCNLASTSTDLWDSVNVIITTIIAVLGITTVVVIIIGGANYVLSQGDPGKIKKARDMILYGVIGLMIALLAFAIVNFVLNNIFGGGSGGSGGTGGSGGETTVIVDGGESE